LGFRLAPGAQLGMAATGAPTCWGQSASRLGFWGLGLPQGLSWAWLPRGHPPAGVKVRHVHWLGDNVYAAGIDASRHENLLAPLRGHPDLVHAGKPAPGATRNESCAQCSEPGAFERAPTSQKGSIRSRSGMSRAVWGLKHEVNRRNEDCTTATRIDFPSPVPLNSPEQHLEHLAFRAFSEHLECRTSRHACKAPDSALVWASPGGRDC
jgi:hypothetical protein